jgi:solute carrier family 25 (mitochondrial S-adenosylmethionine transporter), member 26
VDFLLFPLDTIKTRMQSAGGLWSSGGVRGLYSGIASVALCSAPSAAIFFASYEWTKSSASEVDPPAIRYALCSSISEVAACSIRVPMENVKQKVQARVSSSSVEAARTIYSLSGFRGFYTGFGATLLREIPFAFLQFPMYEWLKQRFVDPIQPSPIAFPLIGSFSGAVAAAATCPLDVIKTRRMLHTGSPSPPFLSTVQSIYSAGGIKQFFSGLAPRVMWISVGGAIFFGAYENARRIILTAL